MRPDIFSAWALKNQTAKWPTRGEIESTQLKTTNSQIPLQEKKRTAHSHLSTTLIDKIIFLEDWLSSSKIEIQDLLWGPLQDNMIHWLLLLNTKKDERVKANRRKPHQILCSKIDWLLLWWEQHNPLSIVCCVLRQILSLRSLPFQRGQWSSMTGIMMTSGRSKAYRRSTILPLNKE